MDRPTSLTVPNRKLTTAEEKKYSHVRWRFVFIEHYELPPPVGALSVFQIVPLTLSTQTVPTRVCSCHSG
jgi:hypothetical protein